MSGKERTQSQDHAKPKEKRRRTDARVRRTHERLGSALVDLIREKPIHEVTVQEVLDRAAVGRSTFYLHFSDKNDLLFSQLEHFLEMMSTELSTRKEASNRVVAVAEMFEHIGGQGKIYRALAESGQLEDFFALAQGYFARGIERRLRESRRATKIPSRENGVRSVALAGSLLSLLRWWMDRGSKESPEEMDRLFHKLVLEGLGT